MASGSGPSGAPPLTDGLNYRVTQGKHRHSCLIVQGNFIYTLNKTDCNRGDEENAIYYLQCKYDTCLARAIIKNGHLQAHSQERVPHTCEVNEGAGLQKIAAQEALNRMKTRAEKEATTFWVCNSFIFFGLS